MPDQTPEQRFAQLVQVLQNEPGVTEVSDAKPGPKRFGKSHELRVQNKIFAMLVRDSLVVKLPKTRVDALVNGGQGERFDTGGGRVMNEWLRVDQNATTEWLPLAKEAIEFVAAKR
jgi:hypothetical protein